MSATRNTSGSVPSPGDRPLPAVGLFAKPVVPGRVKTRLCPPLSPTTAADLYGAFLSDLTTLLDGQPSWDFFLYSTDPDGQRATWPEAASRPEMRPQHGSDLGGRMHAALIQLLDEGRPAALLIGSDHPTLPIDRVREAFARLESHDAVFGPTLDGGYYLVGLSRPCPELFSDMTWSSSGVLAETLERIRGAGISASFLDPWYDVDVEKDLRFLRLHLRTMELEAGPEAARCPRTREALAAAFPDSGDPTR